MTVAIRAMDAALPGENGIKGNLLTGQEVLDLLLGKKKYLLRIFTPKKLRIFQLFIRKLEKVVGIETRNILNDPGVKFPNTYLAVEAGKKTLQKAGVDPSKVQGFVYASDTSDFVFPSPGIAVAKLLGIKPRQFVNCSMACISSADALMNACTWLERGLVDNVLILAGDVTSSLRLPQNKIEPFIFGDGFVGIYLEKGKAQNNGTPAEKGGFTFSNMSVDTAQADLFVHRHIYPSQLRLFGNGGLIDNFQDNDTGLDLLGDIDSRELPLLMQDFLRNSGSAVDKDTKIVLPQTGQKTLDKGVKYFFEGTGIDIKPNVIGNTSFKHHGNIGAGAVPLAWYEASERGDITSSDSIIFCIAGVGGVETVFKYDPNADHSEYLPTLLNTERPGYIDMIRQRALDDQDPKNVRKISTGRPLTQITSYGDNGSFGIDFKPIHQNGSNGDRCFTPSGAIIDPTKDIKP